MPHPPRQEIKSIRSNGQVNNARNYKDGTRSSWEKIEGLVDSGVSNHVGPASVAPRFPIQETQASLSGDYFTGADGSKMRNLGCKDLLATTDTHGQIKTRAQVASTVKQTLLSFSKLVDAGNRVVFDTRGSSIKNKRTNQSVPI